MSGLQTATDIVALVFMGLILLFVLILAITGLVIKRKVKRLQNDIEAKLEVVRNLPFLGRRIFKAIKR